MHFYQCPNDALGLATLFMQLAQKQTDITCAGKIEMTF